MLFAIAVTGPCALLTAQDSTRTWSLEAGVLAVLYRDTTALISPTLTADRGTLHLEARYQWEDWRTGSVWAGRWFEFGDVLSVSVAPMAGLVFGLTNGAAPGCVVDASWKSLSLYSSSEHLFNFADRSGDFTYTWTELSVDLDHLIVGVVAQRTRTFRSPLDLQRGLLLMREQGSCTFGMYLFNAFWTDPTVAFTVSYDLKVLRRKKS